MFYMGGGVTLNNKKGDTQLVLTNLNVIFITRYKKLFSQEEVDVQSYPIENIKIYKGIPQVKSNAKTVEIYLKETEIEFEFESKKELNKFMSEINKLITGKTAFERNAEKVKGAISVVNDTVGFDVVEETKDVVKNGVPGIFGKIGKKLFGTKGKKDKK